jgi:hypothetical protein
MAHWSDVFRALLVEDFDIQYSIREAVSLGKLAVGVPRRMDRHMSSGRT